ncbi:DUF4238 domain-containing protein [Paractinoplanes hotanensis]|uniref:DUF4238 domain-containing protein n=1 Tax=Paractinoplanes hotanensis TaxID=2906497 RepID=A0ABT0Y818_9ACTN|nr:DUF4238 domain-containing protein [Actinoplanes hotanensis]MCM4082183.1 DUF4238 domain-containing protein [Actinoplanes hotanensis]
MTLPPLRDVPREVARLAALRVQAGDNVREQHVVSRSLLQKFADGHRQLHAMSVSDRTAKVIRRGPRGLGKIPNFVPQASLSAEQLWGETERQIPALLHQCDTDAILGDPEATAAIRDLIALHYVRNRSLRRAHQHAYGSSREAAKRALQGQPEYVEDFQRRFGRPPRGNEDLEFFFEMVLARSWDTDFRDGLLLRFSVERLFMVCREWMSERPIQIVHPKSGEFLIGDAPVITLGAQGQIGVALGDAEQIFMPLTPRSLLAFGPSAVGQVPEASVNQLNAFQVRAAHEFVFVRPGSGLEQFVRDTRFGPAIA